MLCVLLAIGIDRWLLVPHISSLLPDYIPLAVLQVLLLPLILLIAARTAGGTKPIKISKAPRPSQRRQ